MAKEKIMFDKSGKELKEGDWVRIGEFITKIYKDEENKLYFRPNNNKEFVSTYLSERLTRLEHQ
jgi:hypothetical protein